MEVGRHCVSHTTTQRWGGEAHSVGWKDSGTMSQEESILAEGLDNALQGCGQEHGTGAPVCLLPRLSTEFQPRDLGQVA